MRARSPKILLCLARYTRISIFSSGGTDSAPFAANCIMFDGSFEARIKSIVRALSSPPRTGPGQTHCVFKLPDRKLQFSNQPVGLVPEKFLQQSPIVPKS